MAVVAGENSLARRRNDGRARKSERPHRAEPRRHIIWPRARRSLCQGSQTYRRARQRCRRSLDRAGRRRRLRIEPGLNLAGDDSDTVTFTSLAPTAIKPAPKGFDQNTLMLMGA